MFGNIREARLVSERSIYLTCTVREGEEECDEVMRERDLRRVAIAFHSHNVYTDITAGVL